MIDPSKLVLATDFAARAFKGMVVPPFLLSRANMQDGGGLVIRDRTFENCLIEGPAVVLGLDGVTFDRCDLGNARGDMLNLLIKPLGDHVTGAVALSNCRFIACQFTAIGFTGHDTFLNALLKIGEAKP